VLELSSPFRSGFDDDDESEDSEVDDDVDDTCPGAGIPAGSAVVLYCIICLLPAGVVVLEDDDEEEDDEDQHEEDLKDQRPVALYHVEELEQLAMRSLHIRLPARRQSRMNTLAAQCELARLLHVRDVHVVVDARDDLALLSYHGRHARVHACDLKNEDPCQSHSNNVVSSSAVPRTSTMVLSTCAALLYLVCASSRGRYCCCCIPAPLPGGVVRCCINGLAPRFPRRRSPAPGAGALNAGAAPSPPAHKAQSRTNRPPVQVSSSLPYLVSSGLRPAAPGIRSQRQTSSAVGRSAATRCHFASAEPGGHSHPPRSCARRVGR
jgi:hypothetical protein